jgi:hypothetical protein
VRCHRFDLEARVTSPTERRSAACSIASTCHANAIAVKRVEDDVRERHRPVSIENTPAHEREVGLAAFLPQVLVSAFLPV